MQGALSALLVSVAGHYAHLSPSDVSIGVTGGRLAVSDVQLRPESFASPALPFRIVSGRAGVLRINVPWGALASTPVKMFLEDVVLVAAPRSTPPVQPSSPLPIDEYEEEEEEEEIWHQTRLGRVLFNVQAEIIGLRIEYRDFDCIGTIEAKALRAHSVDEKWQPAFVPLDGVSGAVAMRKLCAIDGLRCIMVPINIDEKSSFESARPLLEDVNVTVKMLVCAGKDVPNAECNEGLHTELDVELDDPAINLSLRQLEWIQRIHQILDEATNSSSSPDPSTGERTPRRMRATYSVSTSLNQKSVDDAAAADLTGNLDAASASLISNPASSVSVNGIHQNGESKAHDSDSLKSHNPSNNDSADEEEENLTTAAPVEPTGFLGLWQAIVSENSDETVDDAAYALGLQSIEAEKQRLLDVANSSEADRRIVDGGEGSDDDGDDLITVTDAQNARRAVVRAAEAGGFTLRVRFRTPDRKAWDRIEQLEGSLKNERALRDGLEDVETTLKEASERALMAEKQAEIMQEKNEALLRELKELEIMTAKAGKNKDAMIRQTEAALTNAEKNLGELMTEKENWINEKDRMKEENEWKRERTTSTDTFVVNHDTDEEYEEEAFEEESEERNEAEAVVDKDVEEFSKVMREEELVVRDKLEAVQLKSPMVKPLSMNNKVKSVHDTYAEEGLTLL